MLSNACAQLGAFGCGASCNLPRGGVVASVHGAAGAGVAGGGAAGSAVAVAAFSARLLRCFRRRVPRSRELRRPSICLALIGAMPRTLRLFAFRLLAGLLLGGLVFLAPGLLALFM